MQITKTHADGVLHLTIAGRLDGYWAADLGQTLSEAVADGHHHLRLDLAGVTFLSSAGIGTLLKSYKQLKGIAGTFAIVNPSDPVRAVLDMSGLGALVAGGAAQPGPVAPASASARLVRQGIAFDISERPAGPGLRCREFGSDSPLRSASFTDADCRSLGGQSPVFALGIGAFGGGFEDCRARFGELLSVTGATGYQPADGTNVPDYLLSSGALPDDVQLLYGLACEGEFSRVMHFQSDTAGAGVGMLDLLEGVTEVVGAPAVGFVMVSEAASLVGAALRRSPAQPLADPDFFAHPGLRSRLTFTAERAFLRSTTIAAGVVVRPGAPGPRMVRPLGAGGLTGHVHAAAFPYRPLRQGQLDVKETVTSLFTHESLLGVLHLLHDDRGVSGAGESEFIRGACWAGPLVTVEG